VNSNSVNSPTYKMASRTFVTMDPTPLVDSNISAEPLFSEIDLVTRGSSLFVDSNASDGTGFGTKTVTEGLSLFVSSNFQSAEKVMHIGVKV
jgi:hypothetical protein